MDLVLGWSDSSTRHLVLDQLLVVDNLRSFPAQDSFHHVCHQREQVGMKGSMVFVLIMFVYIYILAILVASWHAEDQMGLIYRMEYKLGGYHGATE